MLYLDETFTFNTLKYISLHYKKKPAFLLLKVLNHVAFYRRSRGFWAPRKIALKYDRLWILAYNLVIHLNKTQKDAKDTTRNANENLMCNLFC